LPHSDVLRVYSSGVLQAGLGVQKPRRWNPATATKRSHFWLRVISNSAREIDWACFALNLRVFCGLHLCVEADLEIPTLCDEIGSRNLLCATGRLLKRPAQLLETWRCASAGVYRSARGRTLHRQSLAGSTFAHGQQVRGNLHCGAKYCGKKSSQFVCVQALFLLHWRG